MTGRGRMAGRVVSLALLLSSAGALQAAQPPNYGTARSLQQAEDYVGAIEAYLNVIDYLWDKNPNSNLLPKSYVGLAYCSLKTGDTGLTVQSMSELWETGAWANPNLPQSPEYLGYRQLAEGDYKGAISTLVQLLGDLEQGTKRYQEAKILLAVAHMSLGSPGHVKIATRLLNEVAEEAEDTKLKAFAQWFGGVNFLAVLQVEQAEASFAAAYETDPDFDPSDTAEDILTDQLQPPVNLQNALSDNKEDFVQLAEDYINAWYLTMKAVKAMEEGEFEEANKLYEQANEIWSVSTESSPSFPVN